VDKVEVKVGKELGRKWLWSQVLVAVESIKITAHTSDGKVFGAHFLHNTLGGRFRRRVTIGP